MSKSNSSCLEAFVLGQKARAAYPLRSGRYKLDELRGGLVQDLQQLGDLSSAKHMGRSEQPSHQLPEDLQDKVSWIARVAEGIAKRLGYYIVPAVEALTGDGLPAAEVEQQARRARLEAAEIVRRCDALHDRLNDVVGVNYFLMRRGCSMLEQLLNDTIRLIDEMLRLIEPEGR